MALWRRVFYVIFVDRRFQR